MKKIYTRYFLLTLFLFFASVGNGSAQDEATSTNVYRNISADINEIINTKNLGNTNKYGLAIYSTKLNDYIYKKNATTLLVPASNTKLITSFTTFCLLGERGVVETKILTDGEIQNGVLNGNLYIVGMGDPFLSISDLEFFADEIHNSGIKKINGNIYADDTFFDKETNRWKYSGDADEVEAVAPIHPLTLNRNLVNVVITSGPTNGKKVNVQVVPASSAFVIDNEATVGGSPAVAGKVVKKGKKQTKTRSKAISVTSTMQTDGKQVFHIKGGLQPNKTYSYKYPVTNPALVTAAAFKDRLNITGVIVSGIVAIKKATQNNTIIATKQRNINEIISITNKQSDNYLSEMLFKINGANGRKSNTNYTSLSTAQSASATELQVLKDCGINVSGFVLNDGSGLSRRNLVNAEGLVEILRAAKRTTFFDSLIASLSIAGMDGTLCKRMKNTMCNNNLKAKTGTHNNVSSLTGTLTTKSGDTLFFSYIFNGNKLGSYKQIENEISAKIAEY